MAQTAINFISPQVDDTTQSVLVKAPLDAGQGFRTEQFVRAQVVWRQEPGLTIPAVSVTRINGQYFAFVAETEGQRLRGTAAVGEARPPAWQRLRGGRRPQGRRSPDRVGRPEARRRRSRAAAELTVTSRLTRHVCRHLHPSADSRERLLAGDHPRRRDRHPDAADRAVSRAGAAAGAGDARSTTARTRRPSRPAVTTPLEQAINGVEGMQYMTSTSGNDGVSSDHRHVRRRRATSTSRPSTCRTASRRREGPPAERGEAGRHLGDEGLEQLRAGAPASTPSTASTTRCSSATTSIASSATRSSACPASADVIDLRRAHVRDAALARSRPAGGAEAHRRRRRQRAARAERAGGGRRRSGSRRRAPGRPIRSACARPAG